MGTLYECKHQSPKEGAFLKLCLQYFMNALMLQKILVGFGGNG